MNLKNRLLALGFTLSAVGCAINPQIEAAGIYPHSQSKTCPSDENFMSRFAADSDLLISNFDIKPDLDDVHSIAAMGTVLRSNQYSDLNYVAVVGAYGNQDGEYVDVPNLFSAAFENNWVDAHNERSDALKTVSKKIRDTLAKGGRVWFQEAGQSHFTYDLISPIIEAGEIDMKSKFVVVQHSIWNEHMSNLSHLLWLNSNVSYVRVQDGNMAGNGSPGFATQDGRIWPRLLANQEVGPLWALAKQIADKYNPEAIYVNHHITDGGFDFSDTVELAYILGFDGMYDQNDFFQCFAGISKN
ncbi:hypothetical protein [Hirschia litorea]|uniref:Uncharacterized protein n=1 Tax=Hirschia litorea TaxID=1199156 RepID=A0ABW2ILD3_9PROT